VTDLTDATARSWVDNDERPSVVPILWVLLVTEGMVIRFAPELYTEKSIGAREAERWAWTLARDAQVRVERPFGGRWEVGECSVRLVETPLEEEPADPWVGTYWTRDGYPEPEAIILPSADAARDWVFTSPPGRRLADVIETPWLLAVTYEVRGGKEEAVVQLAKVVAS
jgi:hypothetical protein